MDDAEATAWLAARQAGLTYPSDYRRGVHWAVDEAWKIVDLLPYLPPDTRYLLAGMIAGSMLRIRREGEQIEREWNQQHGAAAQRDPGGRS